MTLKTVIFSHHQTISLPNGIIFLPRGIVFLPRGIVFLSKGFIFLPIQIVLLPLQIILPAFPMAGGGGAPARWRDSLLRWPRCFAKLGYLWLIFRAVS